MVGTAGIEPATPAMSTQCSPAELRALSHIKPTIVALYRLNYIIDHGSNNLLLPENMERGITRLC